MRNLNHISLIRKSILVSVLFLSLLGNSYSHDDYEKMKCRKKLSSFDKSLSQLPLNEIMVEIGKSFLGTPYVAGTLDADPDREIVVVHVTGLDCVTFVENCLVMARMVKSGKTDYETYLSELEKIRYRNGRNTGYASRLHYFSDWIADNEAKGVVSDISSQTGGVVYDKFIDFMTTHPGSYKQLSDAANLEAMREVEKQINLRQSFYIAEEAVAANYDKLRNGDIIGITSTVDGLDISHTGLVYKDASGTYLLHASLNNKEVEISQLQLADYILSNSKQDGIMVARVLDIR